MPAEDMEAFGQLRLWLRELVASDQLNNTQDSVENFDQVTYIVRQALQSDQETQFKEHLELYVAKKNINIEKLCASNYQVSHSVENTAFLSDLGTRARDRPVAQGQGRHNVHDG